MKAMRLVYTLIFLIIILVPVNLRGLDRKAVVAEGEGEALIYGDISQKQAERLALKAARSNAIEKALGQEIHSVTLVKEGILKADIILSLTKGYITGEKILRWSSSVYQPSLTAVPIPTIKVRLRAEIIPQALKDRDTSFTLRAHLNKATYRKGEQVIIELKTSREAYIAIFNLGADDRIRSVFPHDRLKDEVNRLNHVNPGQGFNFPPLPGMEYTLYPLEGEKSSSESFIVIATKNYVDWLSLMGSEGDVAMDEFFRILVNIPISQRAEEILPYTRLLRSPLQGCSVIPFS